MKNDSVRVLGGSMAELMLPVVSTGEAIRNQLAMGSSGNLMINDGQAWNTAVQISRGLYEFTEHTFTSAGKSGGVPPTLAELRTAYIGASWAFDDELFDCVDGTQMWKVPKSGKYQIVATAPGNGTNQMGARVTAVVQLNEGDTLNIIVGQRPSLAYGGYGACVVSDDHGLILVAGAPGGRSGKPSVSSNAVVDLNNPGSGLSSSAAQYSSPYKAHASGASGWLSGGSAPRWPDTAVPGNPLRVNGLSAGTSASSRGAFGGGATGSSDGNAVATGGGGGYTGGASAASYFIGGPSVAGRGGTSYVSTDSRVVTRSAALFDQYAGSVLVRYIDPDA